MAHATLVLLLLVLAINVHVSGAKHRYCGLQASRILSVFGGSTVDDTELELAAAIDTLGATNDTTSPAVSAGGSSSEKNAVVDDKENGVESSSTLSSIKKNKTKAKTSKIPKEKKNYTSYGKKKYAGKKKTKRYGADVLHKVVDKQIDSIAEDKESAERTKVEASDPMKTMQMEIASSVVYMLASRIIFKVNFDDKKTTLICRTIFICYLVFSHLLNKYLSDKVNSLNNESLVEIPDGLADLAGMFGPGGPKIGVPASPKKSVTVKEYDLGEIKKLSGSIFFEILSVTYMHFVTKAGKPLLFVPMVGVLNKLKSAVFQVHVLGLRAEGNLARPFQSGMERMMKSFMPSVAGALKAQQEQQQEEGVGSRQVVNEKVDDKKDNEDYASIDDVDSVEENDDDEEEE